MRILLVEDHEKLARSVKKGLESEGYAVDWVADGEQAYQAGRQKQTFDAAILDLMIPKMSGMDVCRRWRQEGVLLPVLMLTARDTVADRVSGLDAGADDYLPKPFAFEELSARLRALLRRPPIETHKLVRFGDLEIDPATFEAKVDGKEITLTLKEFRLLELFLRHPGQVFSRAQIVNNLWDFEFEGSSNVVDVHVKNLRKKIEAIRSLRGNEHEAIETIRGLGYRLKI